MTVPLTEVARNFNMRADFIQGAPYGSGHINDTFCATYSHAGRRVRYIHQRLNKQVFRNPVALMDNVQRVTEHSLKKLQVAGDPQAYRHTLTCIPSRSGESYVIDADGWCWRTYPFIEGAIGYDVLETNQQAEEAAGAFGAFQQLTADLPGEPLHETIPDFHNTPARYRALQAAMQEDRCGRLESVRHECERYLSREAEVGVIVNLLADGALPWRVTHNDTKLNNVLLDEQTGQAVCVIDLDTTMPGSVVYDFGDMVRTATSPVSEDEQDVSLVYVQMDRFKALVRGYLKQAHEFLTERERELLPFGGKLITLECGARFLTDFLEGDRYFKIRCPEHNLHRARTQLALVDSIEENMERMQELVSDFSISGCDPAAEAQQSAPSQEKKL